MNSFLYKYKSVDRNTLDILIKRDLFFPKTYQFNDPFDGQLLPIDFINELKELGYSNIRKEIENHNNFVKDRIDSYGVLCLSRVRENILMWSHYANSHKGVCFGFKNDLWKYFNNYDWPIIHYKVKYSHIHPFQKIHEDLILNKRFNTKDGFLNYCDLSYALEEATFTVKHSSWKYEKEERIISQISGAHTFKPEALDHIILGMNISSRDEETITQLLKNNDWTNVKVLKAKKGKAALSLDIEEVL